MELGLLVVSRVDGHRDAQVVVEVRLALRLEPNRESPAGKKESNNKNGSNQIMSTIVRIHQPKCEILSNQALVSKNMCICTLHEHKETKKFGSALHWCCLERRGASGQHNPPPPQPFEKTTLSPPLHLERRGVVKATRGWPLGDERVRPLQEQLYRTSFFLFHKLICWLSWPGI